jgi:flavin reductase (DIM6/NTAB) family NADH-FMN oxidoreductase RutF
VTGAEEEFQRLVGGLDYPMYVVTAAAGDRRSGCLVGFGTQCSIEPPRYWVCLSKTNRTYQVAKEAVALGVHVLGPEDGELARLFGEETGDDVDKFERSRWERAPDGVTPVLTSCQRWFVGRVVGRVDVGDHVSFLLHPLWASAGDGAGPALGFQDTKGLDPGHEA